MKKLLLILTLCSAPVIAEQTITSHEEGAERPSEQFNNPLEIHNLIQDAIKTGLIKSSESAELLDIKFKTQADKIEQLEREIEKLRDTPESNLAATVLAGASIIITALGVLIAILSILGYNNIRKEAIKTSRETAKKTVTAIANVELKAATEEKIIELVAKGRFDNIIQNAIANIEYRGISLADSIPEDGEQK